MESKNVDCFVSCDGETEQINAYLNNELGDLFANNLAAPTTAVAQACDAY